MKFEFILHDVFPNFDFYHMLKNTDSHTFQKGNTIVLQR